MSRPATGELYERRKIAVDVQPSGPGHGWEYLGCVDEGDITVPANALTRREYPDPDRAGQFRFAGNLVGERGNPTTSITLRRNKVDALEGLRGCPFGYRRRYYCTGRPDNIHNWDDLDLLCDTRITETGRSGGAVMNSGDNDSEVMIPVSLEAGEFVEFVRVVAGTRVGADLVARDINRVRWCDAPSCGDCDDLVSDGCQVWRAVTDAGVGVYDYPLLITYDSREGAAAEWTLDPIDVFGAGEDVVDLVCIGDQIVVISPAGGFAYSPDGGTTWVAVAGMVAGHPPRALYASGREVWAVGDDGYIYKSDDAGLSWAVEDDGAATNEDLVAVDGWGADTVIAVGDDNAVVRTRNNGRSWAAVGGPSVGDDLTAVAVPREGHVYVGNDVGEVWHGYAWGDTWAQINEIATGGAGVIADLAFCDGCGGEFAYLLHTAVAGDTDLYRSLDGGHSWQPVATWPANSGMNAAACCAHSLAVAVGELHDGYGMIVEIEAE